MSGSTERKLANPNLARNSGRGINSSLDTDVEEEIFTKSVNDFAQSRANDSAMMLNMTEQNTQLGQQLSKAMNMMNQMQQNQQMEQQQYQ